jgi:hypothetical protein
LAKAAKLRQGAHILVDWSEAEDGASSQDCSVRHASVLLEYLILLGFQTKTDLIRANLFQSFAHLTDSFTVSH